MGRSRLRRAGAADGGRFDLAAVFGAAFVVRLAVWLQIRSLPIVRSPQLDSFEYVEWARRLASGDFTWPVPPPHGPGYPFFLALVLKLSGGSLDAAAVVQAALGAVGCVLVARIGRKFFGREAGLFAGLLLAVEGAVALVDVSLFSEGLLLVLLAAALLRLSPDGPARLRDAVAAGAWIGLAALVRPTAVFLLPVAIGSVFLRRREAPPLRSASGGMWSGSPRHRRRRGGDHPARHPCRTCARRVLRCSFRGTAASISGSGTLPRATGSLPFVPAPAGTASKEKRSARGTSRPASRTAIS